VALCAIARATEHAREGASSAAWPAGVGAGMEAALGGSGGRMSAATLTARFGIAGSMRARFAAPVAESKPTNCTTRDNGDYRA
jgi:hypothetical protein